MPCQPRLPVCLTLLAVTTAAAFAAPPKPKPKPNTVKGQGQLAGADGRFGTVYSLQNGFNLEILAAHYTMEPWIAPDPLAPHADQKLLIMDLAIKNATPRDNEWGTEHVFRYVDAQGQLYTDSNFALASTGMGSINLRLRPGQGLGQPALHDPFRTAILLPAKARIVKIMLNQGRLTAKEEKTFRYFVAGATKAEAGEEGDPKNVIAPLPENVRDPADPSGATALDAGKGTPGMPVPSGFFELRFDGFTYSADAITGHAPAKGKRFAVATMHAKCVAKVGRSEFYGLEADNVERITDADGERYQPVAFLKASSPEEPKRIFEKGDEYTYRIVYELPANAQAKSMLLATREGRIWTYDVSGMK
jgi:hypothetical protein